MSNSLSESIMLPQRKLIVSMQEIDLTKNKGDIFENFVFILFVQESRGSAGGRGGGSGMRKISRIEGYRIFPNGDELIYDTNDESKIQNFEIPYSAVAMDILLPTGEVYVVQGIIEPDLIRAYLDIVSKEKNN
ncbi:MAG: hypothetical protein AB7V56_01760 [Candidatus Nitrosocosmicus sp.]|jgi:hypothetical protein|nr:hypothetical protein [Candidatus Nitrosocosmicus sp.]